MARDDTARDSGTERTRSHRRSPSRSTVTAGILAVRPDSQVPADTLRTLGHGGDRRADAVVAEVLHGE